MNGLSPEMVELTPCPFCGCEASIHEADSDGPFWVQCDMCGVKTAEAEYRDNAIPWWNNRFPITAYEAAAEQEIAA